MIVTTGGRSTRSLVGVLVDRLVVAVVVGVDDLDLLAERLGEDEDRLVGQRLGERRHLAHAHQLLDDLGDRDAEVLGDVLDGRAGVDPDDVGRALRGRVERRSAVVAEAPRRPRRRRDAAAGGARRRDRRDHRGRRDRRDGARPASR